MSYKEYDYIRGNTVLNPNRREFETGRTKKKVNNKKKKLKKEARKNLISKFITKEVMKLAGVFVIVGFIILFREANLYQKQDELTNIKYEIKKATAENEALRLQLLEKFSIQDIRNYGEDNMIIPDVNDTINIPMDKNHFSGE